MTRAKLRSLILTGALAAGVAVAAAPAAPKAAATPMTIKAVIAQWKGKDVRVSRDNGPVDMKSLVTVGDDFFVVVSAEGGETYVPLARVRTLNIQGDKLFINLVN